MYVYIKVFRDLKQKTTKITIDCCFLLYFITYDHEQSVQLTNQPTDEPKKTEFWGVSRKWKK